MRRKTSKPKFRWPVLILIVLSILVVLFGVVTITIGPGKIRHYIHKLEYKLNPQKFPNKSKKADFSIFGIDISHHNGRIDWQMVRESGKINGKPVTFAFIKATEGKSFIDKRFKDNFKKAKDAGLICGAYHFYRPNINSYEQFKIFKEVVKLEPGDLAPVLDVEIRGSLSTARYIEGISNLLELMENHYGIKPIIYTSPSLYQVISRDEKIKKYPLWLSAFSPSSAKRFQNQYIILQYTDQGKVAGISSKVDLNGFNGDKKDFQSLVLKKY